MSFTQQTQPTANEKRFEKEKAVRERISAFQAGIVGLKIRRVIEGGSWLSVPKPSVPFSSSPSAIKSLRTEPGTPPGSPSLLARSHHPPNYKANSKSAEAELESIGLLLLHPKQHFDGVQKLKDDRAHKHFGPRPGEQME